MKWFSISKYRGGVKVLKFRIICPLKTLISGRSKHLKNSSKILANTFSDSLAILRKKIASWRRQIFFHRKIPGSLPVPITLSEFWEWLFLFPFHNSLRERTPLTFSPCIMPFMVCSNAAQVSLMKSTTKLFRFLIDHRRSTEILRSWIGIDRWYRPYSPVGEFLSTVDINRDRSTGSINRWIGIDI